MYSQQQLNSLLHTTKKAPSIYQLKSLQNTVVDSANIIWHENFRDGLDGNNSSLDPAWTTGGNDGAIWEYDLDGSNGDYAGDIPYTIESESAANGWMIFDADGSNAGLNPVAYSNRQGHLTSPYIDLSNDSNVTLSFQHAYRWCCYNSHELVVFINDGSGWNSNNSFLVNELGTVNALSGTVTVDIIISDIAALKDSVQIRFDWANGGQTASHYFWMIDDVRIIKTEAYNSNILDSYHVVESPYFGITSYRVMPLEQASQSAYYFGGYLENVGYNSIDSLRLKASIDSEGFTTESYGYSLNSTEKDTIFANQGFSPSDTGLYTANITGSDDFGYVNTDTLSQNFKVSEYIYARDNGDNVTNFGRFGINSDGTRQYGNIFDIYQNATLYAVTLRLDQRTTANATGKIVINTVDPNTGEVNYLTESETLNLGDQTNEWFNVVLDPPVILDAGQVVLPTLYAEYNAQDTVFISTSGTNTFNGESIVQDIDGIQQGVDPGAWLYTTFAPCIRLNFDPNASGINVNVEENLNFKFNIYPNPSNGHFNIQFANTKFEDLILNVSNIIGQSVYSEQLKHYQSIQKTLNLSQLEAGIYYISLSNSEGQAKSKRLVIQ